MEVEPEWYHKSRTMNAFRQFHVKLIISLLEDLIKQIKRNNVQIQNLVVLNGSSQRTRTKRKEGESMSGPLKKRLLPCNFFTLHWSPVYTWTFTSIIPFVGFPSRTDFWPLAIFIFSPSKVTICNLLVNSLIQAPQCGRILTFREPSGSIVFFETL